MKDRYILLVEDNPDDEALTLRAFKKHNILNEVVVAHDGEEALHYLFAEGVHEGRDRSNMPSLILLDIKLPKVDGHEVLERISADERTKSIPVVVLTSSDEEGDIIRSYKNICNSYVRKPVDFNEFIEVVGKLGLYWMLINEPHPKDASE